MAAVEANAGVDTDRARTFGDNLDVWRRGDESTHDPVLADRCAPAFSRLPRHLATTRTVVRDSVANFHLSNGASLERLNWMANPAAYGIEQSFGVMVNYRYDRSKIAANAGSYLADGEIKTSNHVCNLVKTTKR